MDIETALLAFFHEHREMLDHVTYGVPPGADAPEMWLDTTVLAAFGEWAVARGLTTTEEVAAALAQATSPRPPSHR